MRIPIPAIIVPLIGLLLYLLVPGVRDQPWTILRIAGVILAITGYVLFVTARLQLGKSFSVSPQAKELVTHGLYSRIRNPIYISGEIFLAGLVLILWRLDLLIILLVIAPVQIIRARREAAVLEAKFGDAYREYRKRTWF